MRIYVYCITSIGDWKRMYVCTSGAVAMGSFFICLESILSALRTFRLEENTCINRHIDVRHVIASYCGLSGLLSTFIYKIFNVFLALRAQLPFLVPLITCESPWSQPELKANSIWTVSRDALLSLILITWMILLAPTGWFPLPMTLCPSLTRAPWGPPPTKRAPLPTGEEMSWTFWGKQSSLFSGGV